MPKKSKVETYLGREVVKELEKIRLEKETLERARRQSWPEEERSFEFQQRAKVRGVTGKLLNAAICDKQKKVDKKIGGVRGKFHPSLERTRKRT